MRLRALKSLALAIPLVLIFSASALADTCNDFATFTCAGNSNVARLGGGTASGQAVGFVLTGSTFTVFTTNGKAAGDVQLVELPGRRSHQRHKQQPERSGFRQC